MRLGASEPQTVTVSPACDNDGVNVGPAGTLPRAAFNWRDPTVLAAVGQLGGSFDDVGESAQAWPAPARFGEEAPTE